MKSVDVEELEKSILENWEGLINERSKNEYNLELKKIDSSISNILDELSVLDKLCDEESLNRISSLSDKLNQLKKKKARIQESFAVRKEIEKRYRSDSSESNKRARLVELGEIMPQESTSLNEFDQESVCFNPDEENDVVQNDPIDEESLMNEDEAFISTFNELITDDFDFGNYENRILKITGHKCNDLNDILVFLNGNSTSCITIRNTYGLTLKIYSFIWKKLFKYQQTSLRWFWQHHGQKTGGILADEMGLGKTVQVISYLGALVNSDSFKTAHLPVLIVSPATLLKYWIEEFNRWAPWIRTLLFHGSCSVDFKGRKKELINVSKDSKAPCVLLTSYGTLLGERSNLIPLKFSYVILDEGHKIRNPQSAITEVCKCLRTRHRLILSGTPIQNNLKELWSLMDFVFPGKLGSLPTFMAEISVPIQLGGYVNARPVQLQAAYDCALTLRDLISPYIMRRLKADVKSDLPPKKETILFCRMGKIQRQQYKQLVESKELRDLMDGKGSILAGISKLRNICNHSDLFDTDQESKFEFEKCGKLQVIDKLLTEWKKEKHKVLIFSQSRRILCILNDFFSKVHPDWNFLKMDGTTAIKDRMNLVHLFNSSDAKEDPFSPFIFLMTTKVGGLGLNLTGADRVIIFDPDWNPSTDLQARERAWRIGQDKPVHIYRLLCAGTIEEKIYHRQLFKQLLSNRVLKDPKLSRLFKASDLHDLFEFDDESYSASESNQAQNITQSLFLGFVQNDSIDCDGNKESTICKIEEVLEDGPKHLSGKELDDESNLLEGLLESNGIVTSMIPHDKMEISVSIKQDPFLIKTEAEKIAKAAISAMKKSRAAFNDNPNSLSFFPISKSSKSNSSSAIIAALSQKTSMNENLSDRKGDPKVLLLSKIADKLIEFLKLRNGVVTSDSILSNFKLEIKEIGGFYFRRLLKQLCVLQNGKWRLLHSE